MGTELQPLLLSSSEVQITARQPARTGCHTWAAGPAGRLILPGNQKDATCRNAESGPLLCPTWATTYHVPGKWGSFPPGSLQVGQSVALGQQGWNHRSDNSPEAGPHPCLTRTRHERPPLEGVQGGQSVALGQQAQQVGHQEVGSLVGGHPFAVAGAHGSGHRVQRQGFQAPTICHLRVLETLA